MNMVLAACVVGGVALLLAPYLRRDSPLVRAAFVTFGIVVVVRYLVWRTTSTLPDAALHGWVIFAYGFFLLELIATYFSLLDVFAYRKVVNRSAEVDRHLDWYGASPPHVHVLIPSYNEPGEVIEKTLVGATSQTYANCSVWVLDDTRRDWLREMARETGVGYITRPDNRHYKAGNLNHAIGELRARGVPLEFIAVLDADFIARPEFLRRAMALMHDTKVGIVQTPQHFYNPDPFQRVFGSRYWPDEQRAWFDVTLPALDAQNAATCCGTSCVIRVAALQEIGDFPTESVCEDTLASIKMARRGFHTRFLGERLSVGLAAEGLAEFLSQRARWVKGGLQIQRHLGPGRGWRKRVLYHLGQWRIVITALLNLGWPVVLLAFWFDGYWVFQIESSDEALSYFAPLWLQRFFNGWMFGGRRMWFVTDTQTFLLSLMWLPAGLRNILLGSDAGFSVTAKGIRRDRVVVHWRLFAWLAAIAGSLVAALVYTVLDPAAPGRGEGLWSGAGAATLYLILVAVGAAAPTIERPQRRRSERYAAAESVTLLLETGPSQWQCVDLSMGGILLRAPAAATPPPAVTLAIDGVGQVRCKLVRTPSPELAAYTFDGTVDRSALIKKLYLSDRYIGEQERWSLSSALFAFGRWAFT